MRQYTSFCAEGQILELKVGGAISVLEMHSGAIYTVHLDKNETLLTIQVKKKNQVLIRFDSSDIQECRAIVIAYLKRKNLLPSKKEKE